MLDSRRCSALLLASLQLAHDLVRCVAHCLNFIGIDPAICPEFKIAARTGDYYFTRVPCARHDIQPFNF